MKRNHHEILAQIHQGKGTVNQLNPQVKSVAIELDYSDNYEYKQANLRYELLSNDQRVFYVDCINHSCTKKYLDLTNHIESTIREGKTSFIKKVTCDGYQDEERKRGNGNKCPVCTKVDISVTYE